MKKNIYLLIAVAFGTLASCVTPFDPGYDETPVIYVEAFPGASADYIALKIVPAYSRSNSAAVIPFYPEIIFEVNGNSVPTECVDSHEGLYMVHHSSQPGDFMTISVRSEGFRSAYAETEIPSVNLSKRIDYRKVRSGVDSYDNVLYITLSDIDDRYAYGLQLYNETIYSYPSEPEINVYRYAGNLYPLALDMLELAPVSLEAVDIELFGDYLWAWEGGQLKNAENTIAIQPQTYGYADLDSYSSFFVQEGRTMRYDEYGNELGVVDYVSRNKMIFYIMSQEFYNYKAAAQYRTDYDGFLSIVAPANYCYSNIDNGYGVFAGICIVESEWITKEFIENNR